MNPNQPTIAFTIAMSNAVDGPSHCVYSQSYGMEMQVDDEWPLNILIMSPPHLVSSMTTEAEVQSAGMIPGASYTPGNGDYKQIVENGGKWVLAQPSDDLSKILENGLGVILLIDSTSNVDFLNKYSELSSDNLIVAYPIDSMTNIKRIESTVERIRSNLSASCNQCQFLISGSFEHSNLPDFLSVNGVSGLLMLDASFDSILDLVENLIG